jgi:hypothetical protein
MNTNQCEALKVEAAKRNGSSTWGTLGPFGELREHVYKPLKELETDHLENILISQSQISPELKAEILHLLKWDRYSDGG